MFNNHWTIGSHGSLRILRSEATEAFSPSVERRALRTLRQLCEELLQRCPEERRHTDARIMAEPELLQRLPTKENHGGWARKGRGTNVFFRRIYKDGIQYMKSLVFDFLLGDVGCIGLIISVF